MDVPLQFAGLRLEGVGAQSLKVGLSVFLDMIAMVTGHRACVTKVETKALSATLATESGSGFATIVWFYFEDELWEKMNDEDLGGPDGPQPFLEPGYQPGEPPPGFPKTGFRIVGGRRATKEATDVGQEGGPR